ncbi:MAG: ATP-binding protein [bacterium]
MRNKNENKKLRLEAERHLKKKGNKTGVKKPLLDEIKLLHELQVHQVELEMQNEELKRANIAVEHEKEKFSNLYNLSTIGYITVDSDGIIKGLNIRMARLLASSKETFKNKNFKMFVFSELRQAFNEFLKRIFENEDRTAIETVLISKNGLMVNVYIEGKASNSNECDLNVIDITERILSEKKIKELLGKLKKSNENLEKFSYVVAHDLEAPLRTISGFAKLIEKEARDILRNESKKYITFILDATMKMEKLIKDLLTYAQIDNTNLVPEEIALDSLVDGIIVNAVNGINKTGKSIIIIKHSALPHIKAVEVHMRQLFQNLIFNAVKFTALQAFPEIQINVLKEEEAYLFSITDNGIGIEAKDIKDIFEGFRKLRTEKEYAGSGVGLNICKTIVTLYGGKIWVESTLGKKTTFYFTLAKKHFI